MGWTDIVECYGTGGVGVGVGVRYNDIVEVAHMFDATRQVGLGLG